jgi:hypothetical protein
MISIDWDDFNAFCAEKGELKPDVCLRFYARELAFSVLELVTP